MSGQEKKKKPKQPKTQKTTETKRFSSMQTYYGFCEKKNPTVVATSCGSVMQNKIKLKETYL